VGNLLNGPFETEREARAAAHEVVRPEYGWSILSKSQNRFVLEQVCERAGVELGVYDRQILEWLSGRDRAARLFLGGRGRQGGGPAGADGLREEQLTAFLLAEASRGLSAKSLQGRVAELRSLLRFLYLQGVITAPLGNGVPPVPGWKDTGVPRRLAAEDVRVLLDSCDRATASGKRDFAVLLLLARMGLRAAEALIRQAIPQRDAIIIIIITTTTDESQ
jgi:integrase